MEDTLSSFMNSGFTGDQDQRLEQLLKMLTINWVHYLVDPDHVAPCDWPAPKWPAAHQAPVILEAFMRYLPMVGQLPRTPVAARTVRAGVRPRHIQVHQPPVLDQICGLGKGTRAELTDKEALAGVHRPVLNQRVLPAKAFRTLGAGEASLLQVERFDMLAEAPRPLEGFIAQLATIPTVFPSGKITRCWVSVVRVYATSVSIQLSLAAKGFGTAVAGAAGQQHCRHLVGMLTGQVVLQFRSDGVACSTHAANMFQFSAPGHIFERQITIITRYH